jgi:hypothetical protein
VALQAPGSGHVAKIPTPVKHGDRVQSLLPSVQLAGNLEEMRRSARSGTAGLAGASRTKNIGAGIVAYIEVRCGYLTTVTVRYLSAGPVRLCAEEVVRPICLGREVVERPAVVRDVPLLGAAQIQNGRLLDSKTEFNGLGGL